MEIDGLSFRQITLDDFALVRPMLVDAAQTGEYFTISVNLDDTEMQNHWFDGEVWIAEQNNNVLGSYHLKANREGFGNHIANAGYMVASGHKRKGLGRKLAMHSLARAKDLGYRAMQFNFVVSTNDVAIRLWKSLGFTIIGTIPNGFRLKGNTFVDAYIMYLDLEYYHA